MKILLINYEYPPIGAGAAHASWNLARELIQLGDETVVLTASYKNLKGIRDENGVKVYRVRSFRSSQNKSTILEMTSFLFSAAAFLPRLFRREQFDAAIIFFSIPCGPLGLLGKWIKDIPYVISLRGGDVPGTEKHLESWHKLLRPLRHAVLKHSQALVSNSYGLKMLSEQHDPFEVRVIPNGVDSDFFFPRPHENKVFHFLFVGRFQQQKNLCFLLEQMNILSYQSDIPFELHMVGDGPQKKSLQDTADSLRIHDRIFWHGWSGREQLRSHYQYSDCLINPSLYEGMPNVLLEAMACGLPVIASDVIGNNEVVRDGHTGFLFTLREGNDLQHSLRSMIENQDRAKQLGSNARSWVKHKFSWAEAARGYKQLFEETRINAI